MSWNILGFALDTYPFSKSLSWENLKLIWSILFASPPNIVYYKFNREYLLLGKPLWVTSRDREGNIHTIYKEIDFIFFYLYIHHYIGKFQ